MVRSRSRSPRWKRRSLSPVFRIQEHNRQRHNHLSYDCEYKDYWKDPKKSMPWKMEDEKHGQVSSRYMPHETNHHRVYECRSHSPTFKRIPSEDIYSHKSYRTHSPERNENIRRCQFTSRYSEISHKDHNQSFYPTKVREREMHEDTRAAGSTKGMAAFHRSLGTSCKIERKWNENDIRYQQLQEDKYTQSPRRVSGECMPRSSLQKRYPEDRDYREYGHASKKAKEMERYDDREITSNSKWKQDHTSLPSQEKRGQSNLGLQSHQLLKKEYKDDCKTKLPYDYSHKRNRYPEGRKYFSDDREEKNVKSEDMKYNYPKGTWSSKFSDYGNNERVSHTEEPHTEARVKYLSKKGCNSCAKSYKSDASLISFYQKEKERIKKEGDCRRQIDFSTSHQHDTQHKASDAKVSDVRIRKERLTVKVDMKKINKYRAASSHIMERQMSCDLVAVGRKTENFHPVFEHIKSVTQKVEHNSSKFAQEIITIIHHVKANYFKSSDLTLHERFSKIQDKPITEEVKRHSDPEIHRRIDMSLAELQNKRAIPRETGQSVVRVLEDPNDLRHDIERRRKERLQSEDKNTFYVDGLSQRDEQSSSFLKPRNFHSYGFQKPTRFLRSSCRKFIGRSHMNYYAVKRQNDSTHHQFECDTEHLETPRRPFKFNFMDGRSYFKSNLVQKGLYIQAKYQRLRYAGTKGFTTNKFKGVYLRKEKVK